MESSDVRATGLDVYGPRCNSSSVFDQATRFKPCSDPVRSPTRHGTGMNSRASFNFDLQVLFAQAHLEVDQPEPTALVLA